MASLVTRYVDTASTAGGDGTTAATAGATRAFASLGEFRTWLNTNHPSLVANDVQVDCYVAASTGVADAAPVASEGVNFNQTMDATRYLRVLANTGHRAGPSWDTAKYRLVQSNGFFSAMTLTALKVQLVGLQIENTGAKGNEPKGINIPSVNGQNLLLDSCYVRLTGTGTPTGNANPVNITLITTADIIARNCIFTGGINDFFRTYASSGALTALDNCLAYGGTNGFTVTESSGHSILVRNCLSGGHSGADYSFPDTGGAPTGLTSLSEDTTSPVVAGRSQTLHFEDAANGDFRLASSATEAIDVGTDLSADATNPFATDMEGTARPAGAWDIGPHEYVSVGGGGGAGLPLTRRRRR